MSAESSPVPVVPRFVSGRHRFRKARGFSLAELKQAGLNESHARSMSIRIDRRRTTVHSQNVTSLSKLLRAPPEKAAVSEPSTKTPAAAPELERRARPRAKKTKPAAKKRSSRRKK